MTVNWRLQGFQKGGCASCHIIPGVPGATGVLGPDLSEIGQVAAERLEARNIPGRQRVLKNTCKRLSWNRIPTLHRIAAGTPARKG